MTSIYSLTCIGISSKLISSLSRSNCALFNPQGENNASHPNKTKWLASTRDLKGTLNNFLEVLVSSWSFQSCVYTYAMVLVQCRRALLSSALGKKYWQVIMTRKSNSNAIHPFKKRTTLWRKKKKSIRIWTDRTRVKVSWILVWWPQATPWNGKISRIC